MTTATTPNVLEAVNIIIEGIEAQQTPPGLEASAYYFTSTRSLNDRYLPASLLYSLLVRMTGLSEGAVKRAVKGLVGTGQLIRDGESTATAYTLPRVKEQERQARLDLDVKLREIGTRLESHGLEVIYRFLGYGRDVTDLNEAKPGSLVNRIKLGTSLEALADLLDLPSGQNA